MPVQNFLEDEDYDPADESDFEQESEVPDFLADEEFDGEELPDEGDEYYGGGFNEGVNSSSYGVGFAEEFEGEEELFDGADPFEQDDDTTLDGDEESSPYGISGIAPVVRRTAPPRVESVELSLPTEAVAPEMNSDGVASNGVPNFLDDEEEYDSTPSTPSAPPSPMSTAQGRSEEAVQQDGGSAQVATSQSGSSISDGTTVRVRRDLSRRPTTTPSDTSTPSYSPSIERSTPVDSSGGTSVESPSSEVGSAPSPSSSTPSVSFDARVRVAPPSEEEAAELRAPSSYAEGRELKYTALRQSESTVRRVGADGLTPAERARAKRRSEPKLRTPSNGKLSQEELLFYANLGARRAGDYGGESQKELFRAPLFGESEAQRKEREARINRALPGGSLARGARTRLTEKDYRVLQFIALFKFVSERQIAKLLQVGEHAAYKRLNGLRKHGLTKGFKTLGVKGSVWVLTETGMDLSGYELPRGTEGALTLSMVSHQFTVNHVAAHLWSGSANVLREKNFPQKNRPDGSGGFALGERLISELQIQSTFSKLRGTTKADAYVPQIRKQMASQFDAWRRAGGVDFGPSPELQLGNEHMWTLFPPVSNRLNHHVPDLVVARPRGADGKPQSIAVEIELRTKADDASYERTLDAYRADEGIYRKVVWVCRLKGTAEKLTRIAKRNGLADQGRIAIVPIYLEDGSRFTGRDTWGL